MTTNVSPVLELERTLFPKFRTEIVRPKMPIELSPDAPGYDWRLLDIEDVITEDETPVDSPFSEKQQRLLVEILMNSLARPLGKRLFWAAENVGLYSPHLEKAIVPDMFVSLDIKLVKDIWRKQHRCYFVKVYGKPPDVVIEIVSNRKGNEDGDKIKRYALAGVPYYIIYDPEKWLSKKNEDVLRCYELRGRHYVRMRSHWLSQVGLGVMQWEGIYDDRKDTWLRWCDRDGRVYLTKDEQAIQERQRVEQSEKLVEQERQRAEQSEKLVEQERQRAEHEQQRAEQSEKLVEQERQRAEQQLKEVARAMLAQGFTPTVVAELTNLALDDVTAL